MTSAEQAPRDHDQREDEGRGHDCHDQHVTGAGDGRRFVEMHMMLVDDGLLAAQRLCFQSREMSAGLFELALKRGRRIVGGRTRFRGSEMGG